MEPKKVEIKESAPVAEAQGNKTMDLFMKASENTIPLTKRSHVTMQFTTAKDGDKEIRELVFENNNVQIRTTCPATEDVLKDELECYKGMCFHVLGAIDELE